MFYILNQFNFFTYLNLNFINILFININNLNLVIFSIFVLFSLTYNILLEEINIIPRKVQYIYEMLFIFVYDMLYVQTNKQRLKYFPLLIIIFIMIVLLNIISLFILDLIEYFNISW